MKTKRKKALIVVGYFRPHEELMAAISKYTGSMQETVDKITEPLVDGGYEVEVLDQPSLATLEAKMNSGIKSAIFINHGEISTGNLALRINQTENITPTSLREWAFKNQFGDGSKYPKAAQMKQVMSYGLDYSVVHACKSADDPNMASVLGGKFLGNNGSQMLSWFPNAQRKFVQVDVSTAEFNKDPIAATRAGIFRALKRSMDSSVPMDEYFACIRLAAWWLANEKFPNVVFDRLASTTASIRFVNGPVPPESSDHLRDFLRKNFDMKDPDKWIRDKEIEEGVPAHGAGG